jgi:hypothetical protein
MASQGAYSAHEHESPPLLASSLHYYFFLPFRPPFPLPLTLMLGYFARTFRLIVACSEGDACCAPRARALRALPGVSMGYEPGPLPPLPVPFPGSAKSLDGSALLCLAVIAMIHSIVRLLILVIIVCRSCRQHLSRYGAYEGMNNLMWPQLIKKSY